MRFESRYEWFYENTESVSHLIKSVSEKVAFLKAFLNFQFILIASASYFMRISTHSDIEKILSFKVTDNF